MNGGTSIAPSSRPSNDASLDMGLPPRPSRLYGRSGRAALTAGTLTPVGDNVTGENMERNVEVRHPDGYYPDVMPTDHEPREWYDEAERLRQSRLRRWQTIRVKPSPPHCKDCGARTNRVVTITVQWPQGSEKRHEWLCASCEYLREHPNAPRFVKPPRERAKRLQKETLLDLLSERAV